MSTADAHPPPDEAGPELTTTSYLVLGLLALEGSGTPYDLKQRVQESVGYFWSFPHSQLYAEPARLADAGLLVEHRETGGRRRRTFTITPAGRRALQDWLADAGSGPRELRDPGLLKLFFADEAEPDAVVALADGEAASHRERLAVYEAMEAQLAELDERPFGTLTLRMGLAFERTAVAFWDDVAREARRRRAKDAGDGQASTKAGTSRS
jgi:PadR family transcriptional regulator, regulatory protein AphA